MKPSIVALAFVSAIALTTGTAAAQKGHGAPKTPKAKVTQSAPKAGGGAPKVHGNTSQGPKMKSGSPGATKAHAPKTHVSKTHGKPAKSTTASSAKVKGGDRSRTTSTMPGTTVALTPVQQKLQRNTNLARKLEGRLPAGMNVIDAAEGFRNLGQFVAAVNVSNNLGISFTDLKSRMVDDRMSLGQAIKAERSDVADVGTVVRRAERDAQLAIADDEAGARTKTAKAKTTKPVKAKARDGR